MKHVYLCYEVIFGELRLKKVLSSEEEAKVWVSRNPEYLTYSERELEHKAYQ